MFISMYAGFCQQRQNSATREYNCVCDKMGRKPCCAEQGLNKGAWFAGEDKILVNYIQIHGEGKWRDLPQKAGLKRCGKSCRLRWLNYLRPDIRRGNISEEEEQLIIKLHDLLGNRWSLIAGRLPGRTDNEIKNYWNTNLSKRLKRDGKSTMPQCQSKKNGCSRNSSLKLNSEEIKPQPPRVFRTKAVRCTKVVIPGLLDYNQTVDNIGKHSQSSSALQEDTNSAGDLLMDYDISKLLISDALSSDGSLFQANEINGSGDHDDDHNMADGDLYHLSPFKNMSCFPECSDSAYKAIFEDLMDECTIPDNWMDR